MPVGHSKRGEINLAFNPKRRAAVPVKELITIVGEAYEMGDQDAPEEVRGIHTI